MLKITNILVENSINCVTDVKKPRISYVLESDKKDVKQESYRLQIGSFDSGVVKSQKSYLLDYEGTELKPFNIYSVNIEVTDNHGETACAIAQFETGRFDVPWQGKWITDLSIKADKKNSPLPMTAVKKLKISKQVKSARLYATALGNYFFSINGQKVGKDYLAPGYTSYESQLQYQVYDVTDMLAKENTLVAVVSGGWAIGLFGFSGAAAAYGERQLLLAELRLIYEDGTEEVIGTDSTWGVTKDGAYKEAELYNGVVYDANVDVTAVTCKPADVTQLKYHPNIIATYGTLSYMQEELKPIEQHVSKKGGAIYDFGQNFSGIVKLKINKATKGQFINVRHAEVLIDGEIFTSNLRKAKARIDYICRDGKQEFIPNLTTMGFRYIRVQGIEPENVEVSAFVVSSVSEAKGTFECSNANINQLQSNIYWGGRSNFVDIPTDCPQRDERMGWTGDIAVFASTACYNFDMSRFLDKWLMDLIADQGRGGGIPMVIPKGGYKVPTFALAGWGDCATLVPWALYIASGNLKLLRRQYTSMKKLIKAEKFWASFLSVGDKAYVWKWPFQFGDWLAYGEEMKMWTYKGKWLATAYFYNSCMILAKIAKLLGETGDEEKYLKLAQRIKTAYRNVFTNGKGKLKFEFESAYVCPIYFGMVEGEEKQNMGDNLARLVRERNYKLGTGFLGTPYLLFALSDTGHFEEAYKVLLQEECPGWLYTVKAGGTTIWERWDALKPDGTVNLDDPSKKEINTSSANIDPEDQALKSMISFNHYAYGSVGDWLYRRVIGIEAKSGGYKTFKIAPQPGGALTYAKGSVSTPYGKIVSDWKIDNGKFSIKVSVPVGTECELTLPNKEVKVLKSGEYEF